MLGEGQISGSIAVVVPQNHGEPVVACNFANTVIWLDRVIAETLVVAFLVIVFAELGQGAA